MKDTESRIDSRIRKIIMDVAAIVKNELDSDYQLFLFGSRADGHHDDRSDIDIGILSAKQITPGQLL